MPRLDGGDIATALHMNPPYIDIDDPALARTRSWHWLRERVLAVIGAPATPTVAPHPPPTP